MRPERRLSAVYLLLFGYVGIYLPWFPPLLFERGFDARTIGLALALVTVSRVLFPPLWGLLADRTTARRRILVAAAALAGAAMAVQAADIGPATRMVWLFVHGFFLVPLFPLVDALTLATLGPRSARYGRVRLWGSIGFIVASLGFGGLVREVGLGAVPLAAGGALLLAGALVAGVGASPSASRAGRPRAGAGPEPAPPMPWARLLPVVGAAALGQASHGPYYAFFTLQLERRGLAPEWIGGLWAWGVAAEVVLMALSPRILGRFGLAPCFRAALVLTVARWALYATEPALPWLVAGQTLHAASFGLLHVSTVQLVDRISPPGRKALGQTVLSACAYGGGIGAGLFVAGQLAEPLGDAGLYVAAAVLCAAGLLVSAFVRAVAPAEREPATRGSGRC